MHHRKTVWQVSLRFLIQEGAIVIPRTSKRERLEKRDDFYFKLDPAEMDEIASFKIGAGTIKEFFPSSSFQNCGDICWSRHRYARA